LSCRPFEIIGSYPGRTSTTVNSRDSPQMARFVSSRRPYWSTWIL